MNEEKKLDEKVLEDVAGGGEYDWIQSPEEIQAAKLFRESFISANCSRCSRRDTECTYPSGDVFDTLAMYHMFKDLPGCTFIVVKWPCGQGTYRSELADWAMKKERERPRSFCL